MSKWGPWNLNPSLVTLVAQLKAKHPGIVIGTIADDNHKPPSDHIPNGADRVNAIDPMLGKGGFNTAACDELVSHLIKDPRVKYLIWKRRIWNRSDGWKTYAGSDPHTGHVHLSVLDSSHTNTREWQITERDVVFRNFSAYLPTLVMGDSDPVDGTQYVRRMQLMLNFCNNDGQPYDPLTIDGNYGRKTAAAISRLMPNGDDGGVANLPVWVRLYGLRDVA